MKSRLVTPAALLVVLSGVVTAHKDAPAKVVAEAPSLPAPACLRKHAHAPDRARRYDAAILRHSRKRGLNPNLVKAIIAVESQFTPTALSHCGARGLMQVMPATGKEMGIKACDLWDPETNISAGTAYLALLFKAARRRSGQGDAAEALVMRRVIAAYFAGPVALEAQDWSPATRNYVSAVLNCYTPEKNTAEAPRTRETAVASLDNGRDAPW